MCWTKAKWENQPFAYLCGCLCRRSLAQNKILTITSNNTRFKEAEKGKSMYWSQGDTWWQTKGNIKSTYSLPLFLWCSSWGQEMMVPSSRQHAWKQLETTGICYSFNGLYPWKTLQDLILPSQINEALTLVSGHAFHCQVWLGIACLMIAPLVS